MKGGYKELIVWNKSMALARIIYKLTSYFPREEQYGLINQMRRAAVSIPSNIAEGSKRGTEKDFTNFLRTALGSSAELETQLTLAKSVSFGQEKDYDAAYRLLNEVMRMLTTMIIRSSKDS